jgi:Mg2+ and Co2+ transporter CorA
MAEKAATERRARKPGQSARKARTATSTSGRNRRRDASVEGLRAFLYDASAPDKEVELSDSLTSHLQKDQLLWIDVDLSSTEAVERVLAIVDADEEELREHGRPPVRERGERFSFTVPALAEDSPDAELVPLTCVVSSRWLVTSHAERIGFVDAFDEHVRSDSSLGSLDGPSFLASLLEWQLNDFFVAVETVQQQTDELEERILVEKLTKHSLDDLVRNRRRLTYLRGGLAPHRYVYATLAHPGFDTVFGGDAAADFALLAERVEQAVQATEAAREMVVGAFDLYMTQTAQRTNDVMKLLTILSAVLLPATVLAGVFGMNMLPKLFLHQWFFAVAVGLMVTISATLLALLHRRGWL